MPNLDAALYRWIFQANEKRDDLGLPPGFIEESIALLKRVLGEEYLEQLLIVESGPIPVMDDDAHPLRKWLLSAHIFQHIVQVMELASYFRAFEHDPALSSKVEKLKRDSFWSTFFELAMATRAKRACLGKEKVFLNPEVAESIGDFTISVPGALIPVECSRLGRSLIASMASPKALLEALSQKLGEAGMETSTLQKHLVRGQQPDTGEKRLYVLDESSLSSTRQVHECVNRLHANDRVLFVGDRRQHEAVEAGRPFAQLQDAGMKTVKLEEIVRQKDPELKQVVEQLAQGEVQEAIQNLDRQGRVHEIQSHDESIAAIAKEYAQSPEYTLVISPDNRSRIEINERIHAELQRCGLVSNEEHRIRTLVPRQDLTGADRTWAERYDVGDVLRYSRASKETGVGKGEYALVKSIDVPKNRLTVELQDGTQRTYDPRRQQGVSVFREEMRSFSVGDRIQFTVPASDLRVANRELATIESIHENGRLRLKMDGGRMVELNPPKHPHLDYGYAMTSHSSQGQTADRVLIHVDTELGAKDLLNSRMAYVSVSRGRYDAQIYTNNAATLGQELSRDVSHSPAIQQEPGANKIEPQTLHTNQISRGCGLGL